MLSPSKKKNTSAVKITVSTYYESYFHRHIKIKRIFELLNSVPCCNLKPLHVSKFDEALL